MRFKSEEDRYSQLKKDFKRIGTGHWEEIMDAALMEWVTGIAEGFSGSNKVHYTDCDGKRVCPNDMSCVQNTDAASK